MNYQIEYDKQPQKFVEKSDRHIALRLIGKIEEVLANNSVPHGAKAIVGEHGVFRVRIGDYRALYRINHTSKKIIVFKIEHRSDIY